VLCCLKLCLVLFAWYFDAERYCNVFLREAMR
jgi:hypothetical protein